MIGRIDSLFDQSRFFMKNSIYYHVSDVLNVKSIIKLGLKSKLGFVYLFDSKIISASIACYQLFLINYALFEIRNLDESLIEKDEVAEFSSENQFIFKGDISPEKIKFIGCFKII